MHDFEQYKQEQCVHVNRTRHAFDLEVVRDREQLLELQESLKGTGDWIRENDILLGEMDVNVSRLGDKTAELGGKVDTASGEVHDLQNIVHEAQAEYGKLAFSIKTFNELGGPWFLFALCMGTACAHLMARLMAQDLTRYPTLRCPPTATSGSMENVTFERIKHVETRVANLEAARSNEETLSLCKTCFWYVLVLAVVVITVCEPKWIGRALSGTIWGSIGF